mgnify:CR=1 FL=1
MTRLLRRQLQESGASKQEAIELANITRLVHSADLPTLDKATKARIAREIGIPYYSHRRVVQRASISAFAVLTVLVLALAQTAKPGTSLYAVRKTTTSVKQFVRSSLPFVSPEPTDNTHSSQGDDPGTSNGSRQKNEDTKHRGSSSGSGGKTQTKSSNGSRDNATDDSSKSGSGSTQSSGSDHANKASSNTSGSGSNNSGSSSGSDTSGSHSSGSSSDGSGKDGVSGSNSKHNSSDD